MAITAGTVQPNPRSIGIKALPDRPILFMIPFITYATLAIYPLSSKNARDKNKIAMFGKKVNMVPTPAIIPSIIRDFKIPPTFNTVSVFCAHKLKLSNQPSNISFIPSPKVNVSKNTSPIMPKKIGSPRIL